MNLQLIMLPNPILVSDERIKIEEVSYHHSKGLYKAVIDGNYTNQFKVIAGIEGKPKLDLSDIAEEVGWIDVEKLAQKNSELEYPFEDYRGKTKGVDDDGTGQALRGANLVGFENGFKAAQSLNEKKFSEKDLYGLLKLIGQKGTIS